jgi:hypothetical protein
MTKRKKKSRNNDLQNTTSSNTNPLQIEREHMCSGRVSSSCSTSDTRRVTMAIKLANGKSTTVNSYYRRNPCINCIKEIFTNGIHYYFLGSCFDSSTFISVTTVLSVIFTILLGFIIYNFVRIHQLTSHKQMNMSMTSFDSKTN